MQNGKQNRKSSTCRSNPLILCRGQVDFTLLEISINQDMGGSNIWRPRVCHQLCPSLVRRGAGVVGVT